MRETIVKISKTENDSIYNRRKQRSGYFVTSLSFSLPVCNAYNNLHNNNNSNINSNINYKS